MIDYLRRPIVHEAIFKKYASKKFLKGELQQIIVFETIAKPLQLRSSPGNGPGSMPPCTLMATSLLSKVQATFL